MGTESGERKFSDGAIILGCVCLVIGLSSGVPLYLVEDNVTGLKVAAVGAGLIVLGGIIQVISWKSLKD